MKRHLLPLITLLLANCLVAKDSAPADATPRTAATAPSTSGYVIQLTRKATVGDHYHVDATGSGEQRMSMSTDGQAMPPMDQSFTVNFSASGEVLALTPSGKETKTKFKIEKATLTAQGQTNDLFPAGTEMIAESNGGETQFLVGDSPVSPQITQALITAGVAMSSDENANDDQIFGTKDRKKAGDSWPINAAAAIPDLKKTGLIVEADNLSGKTTLNEVIKTGAQESLRISGTMTMHGITPPAPEGFTVDSFNFEASFGGIFPVELAQRPSQTSSTFEFKMVLSGTNEGKKITQTVTNKRSFTIKFSSK